MPTDRQRRFEVTLNQLSPEALKLIEPVTLALMREIQDPKLFSEVLAAIVATLPPDTLESFEQSFVRFMDAIVRAEMGVANDPS